MMPDRGVIRVWLRGGSIVIIVLGLIFVFGANTLVNDEIFTPFVRGLNTLSGVFAFMIALNVFAVALLALVENTIEYITGDSATFKDGKMITMTREEAKAMRLQLRQKELQTRQQQKRAPLLAGPPSIYKLEFPVPAAPRRCHRLCAMPEQDRSSWLAAVLLRADHAQNARPVCPAA